MYGVGIGAWVNPLSECLRYVEAGFQYNKQVRYHFALVEGHNLILYHSRLAMFCG
jgi:hypothetical protein